MATLEEAQAAVEAAAIELAIAQAEFVVAVAEAVESKPIPVEVAPKVEVEANEPQPFVVGGFRVGEGGNVEIWLGHNAEDGSEVKRFEHNFVGGIVDGRESDLMAPIRALDREDPARALLEVELKDELKEKCESIVSEVQRRSVVYAARRQLTIEESKRKE